MCLDRYQATSRNVRKGLKQLGKQFEVFDDHVKAAKEMEAEQRSALDHCVKNKPFSSFLVLLPAEVWGEIMVFLTVEDVTILMQLSKHLKGVLQIEDCWKSWARCRWHEQSEGSSGNPLQICAVKSTMLSAVLQLFRAFRHKQLRCDMGRGNLESWSAILAGLVTLTESRADRQTRKILREAGGCRLLTALVSHDSYGIRTLAAAAFANILCCFDNMERDFWLDSMRDNSTRRVLRQALVSPLSGLRSGPSREASRALVNMVSPPICSRIKRTSGRDILHAGSGKELDDLVFEAWHCEMYFQSGGKCREQLTRIVFEHCGERQVIGNCSMVLSEWKGETLSEMTPCVLMGEILRNNIRDCHSAAIRFTLSNSSGRSLREFLCHTSGGFYEGLWGVWENCVARSSARRASVALEGGGICRLIPECVCTPNARKK